MLLWVCPTPKVALKNLSLADLPHIKLRPFPTYLGDPAYWAQLCENSEQSAYHRSAKIHGQSDSPQGIPQWQVF